MKINYPMYNKKRFNKKILCFKGIVCTEMVVPNMYDLLPS